MSNLEKMEIKECTSAGLCIEDLYWRICILIISMHVIDYVAHWNRRSLVVRSRDKMVLSDAKSDAEVK